MLTDDSGFLEIVKILRQLLPSSLMLRFRTGRPNVYMSFKDFQDFAGAIAAASSANIQGSITSTFKVDPISHNFLPESCVFIAITDLGMGDPKWRIFAHYLALRARDLNKLYNSDMDDINKKIENLTCFAQE